MSDELIPETPTAEEYEAEKKAQEAFGVEVDQGDVFGAEFDPMELFKTWLALAKEHEINDPNAMAVASVDDAGMPDVRMVLLKDVGPGFSFYTNMESAKGDQLKRNPASSICFHWKSIRRQVRIRGLAEVISDQKSDAYFARRDRGARIGAWASQQSRVLDEPGILTQRIADYEDLYKDQDVPRPPVWQGFVIMPEQIEFWVNRPFRLHERKRFTRTEDGWTTDFLYP